LIQKLAINDTILQVIISFLHFLYGKKTKQKKPPRAEKYGLPLSHNPTLTKAGQTAFRAARGQANTHGEF
jgi:hypothetical protein